MYKEELISKLKEHDILPESRFGQNFLCDEEIIEDIIDVSGIELGSKVLEVGPGAGALTQYLCKMRQEAPSMEIVAVEIDKRLASFLIDDTLISANAQIVCADFLKTNSTDFGYDFDYCISNIPYYVMTPIMKKLLCEYNSAKRMTFMVEDEAIARIIAQPSSKQYGPLAVLCSLYGACHKEFSVDYTRFYPMPHTLSSVITLTRGDSAQGLSIELAEFVEAAFSKRRKTLSNSLKEYFVSRPPLKSLNDALKSNNLDERVRSEALTPGNLLNVYQELYIQQK